MANFTFQKKVVFLFIYLFFVSLDSYTQQKPNFKNFSSEYAEFIDEMKIFMKINSNTQLKSSYKELLSISEGIEVEDKKLIIQISNLMLNKKMKPKPHFISFIESLNILKSNSKRNKIINEWLVVLDHILRHSSTKRFMTFCDFTNDLIVSNNLRSTKSVSWKVNSMDFNFSYVNNEPAVIFQKEVDLFCSSKGANIKVYKTTGSYYPIISEWEGVGGIINWQDHGLSSDSIYATIDKYNLDTRRSKIVCDSAIFVNKSLFNKGIIGQLVVKGVSGTQSDKYPMFTSYSKNIQLKDIFPNIDYKGGYKLVGKNFIADGGDLAKARIIFKKNGKDLFIANSKKFTLDSDKITSKETGVKIFFDNDSIYHPNLKFKYINSNRKLELLSDLNRALRSKMLNTYHKITMEFELLEWKIDSEIINFGSLPASATSQANFESYNMFDNNRYNSLKGIDKVHPLILVKRYATKIEKESFYVKDFANYTGFPLHQIVPYFIRLAGEGFVFYDYGKERITIQPMLYNYIRAASEIGDYDVLAFRSSLDVRFDKLNENKKLTNAILNINTKDLQIFGVKKVPLSNKRGIMIFPENKEVILKKNRDFKCKGELNAGTGRLKLFAQNVVFDYDKFTLEFNDIDSLKIKVPFNPRKIDMRGNDILTDVKTILQFDKDTTLLVQAELIIDHPLNKSGNNNDLYGDYPKFETFERSYAYYDQKNLYNGVYNRNNFYFKVDPFTIDSVNSFSRKGLDFPGTFYSADIFPVFRDTLSVMKDNFLGFNRKTSEAGFAIYKGKANYKEEIRLDGSGLKGSGEFSYLNSNSLANDIMFFPDSTNLVTNKFNITKETLGIEFPTVFNDITHTHFLPYKDELYSKNKNNKFQMYDNKSSFSGDLLMKPTGLTGSGEMVLENAEITSNIFKYNADWFQSDTSNLVIYDTQKNIALKALNLRSYIDLSSRNGIFNSNGDISLVELIANQYVCNIDQLNWKMDEEMFFFSKESNNSKQNLEFISMHPNQDSLRFSALDAQYSLKDFIIHASGVEELRIADAIILPDSGIVKVDKKGIMHTLFDAKIIVDDLTSYHSFTKAIVDVNSAFSYVASGDYSYKDALNNEQILFFEKISVNSDTVTFAKASIKEDTLFNISSKFDFKGDIELTSDIKNLTFDGFFMLKHKCDLIPAEWVKFKSEIDPENIYFKLDKKIYNDKGDLLSNALMMSKDSSLMYNTFLNLKRQKSDYQLFNINGDLKYDYQKEAFIIGDTDTLANYYMLYDNVCKLEGYGKVDLNLGLSSIDIQSVGSFSHEIEKQNVMFNGFMLIDFFFSEDAMDLLVEDILDNDLGETLEESNQYENNLQIAIGSSMTIDEYYSLEEGSKNFPKNLNKSFVFVENTFVWSQKKKQLLLAGDIWVGNVYNKPINVLLEGYLLIDKSSNSNSFNLYFTESASNYLQYYFEYKQNKMKVWSANSNFRILIDELPDGKRKVKRKKNRNPFSFNLGKEEDMNKFLFKVKNNKL